ncbi:ROK family protein [Candidatus Sumerlaeota bacterium]|nr:ROK family protein [Candidatus Sumerlaeota bacterium]
MKSIRNKVKDGAPPLLGVDLGGTKILACVVDEHGKILSRCKKKTKPEKSSQEVISRIALCSRSAVAEAGLEWEAIGALGIGAPGALNPHTGVINLAPNLNWKHLPLKDILEKELKIPVFINNDVNMGVLGEHRIGAGKGMRNVMGIFIGTGIGGGLVINGNIYEGSSFMAGEIGHIPMVENGPPCGCGKKGCFEAVAGRLAIVREIQSEIAKGGKSSLQTMISGGLGSVKSKHLAQAWKEKDPLVMEQIEKAAHYIGLGVSIAITILNPDAIILGGGVIEALDAHFIKKIAESAREHTIAPLFKATKIRRALLGDDAIVIGSALYAREHLEKT